MKNLINKKLLIVGLGNPQALYKNTRHNCGALFLEWLKENLKSEKFKINQKVLSEISILKTKDKTIFLVKPLTFMNNSGEAVKKLKNFFKLKNKEIIIVHDDSDLFLGSFKIQFKRGSAGHKGVESIINSLKTNEFYRIRIGVRPKNLKKLKAEYFILKNFSLKEREILNNTFQKILTKLNFIREM
ncbi:MAG: aminoacyl-tRNA hydrolase [Minisyncoccia bacterium]